ncbi:uncharacterized protein BDW43DRAFT_299400 [Aspergillus alliaceus]|uniref:uncharacterized protein n=1 Tax=Petromyces alliaceus TaxID=209559 RepID=UPI0012A4385A|nr:uncharacterized protein BDW43DRAFT_299400 [Aspergillus alliaceus]KAB8234680.1 hypothetical protein BDW43DRAFT_299400 [Aspergillus alliaceus]
MGPHSWYLGSVGDFLWLGSYINGMMIGFVCIYIRGNSSLLQTAIDLVAQGLVPTKILDLICSFTDLEINTEVNKNPREPETPIYPRKYPEDAPCDVDEGKLRSAFYIPSGFSYGANGKQPVLLVSGTAYPMWVNLLGISLEDFQTNAEYIAYAINYISGVSNKSPIGYWLSTRGVVSDFIPISSDFHGTLLEGNCIDPSQMCTPAIKQQGYESNFVHALRANNGDSAYVATTSMYSGVDLIVQPQTDPDASAALYDVRKVGVTNVKARIFCPGKLAGSFYFHKTMLASPVSCALVVDALKHDGPGSLKHLPGSETMAILYSMINVMTYKRIGYAEPPLKEYVRRPGW